MEVHFHDLERGAVLLSRFGGLLELVAHRPHLDVVSTCSRLAVGAQKAHTDYQADDGDD